MINAAREGLRKWTKVAELDASTFLAQEPSICRYRSQTAFYGYLPSQKGLHIFQGLKTGFE